MSRHPRATLAVAEGLPEVVHLVTSTIHPEQPDKAKILSERHESRDDPKRFAGTAGYVGAVLLFGKPVALFWKIGVPPPEGSGLNVSGMGASN